MSEFRLGSSDGLVKDGISFVIVRKKIVERNFFISFSLVPKKNLAGVSWRNFRDHPSQNKLKSRA